MLRKFALSISLFLSMASRSALSSEYKYNLLNCTDCFNFVAPSIYGAETLGAAAEIGLLTYDTSLGFFRGYDQLGNWSKLSNEVTIRATTSTTVNVSSLDDLVSVDATSGNTTVNLPAAASVPGKSITLKRTDASTNSVTIDPNSSELIDGLSTKKLIVQKEIYVVVSDGTGWQIVRHEQPLVGAKYCKNGVTYTVNADAKYILSNKAYDTTNSYSTSTGLWTAPADGTVRVTGQTVIGNGTAVSGVNVSMQAKKNGSNYTVGGTEGGRMARSVINWAVNAYSGFGGSTVIPVVAGDTLQVNYEVYVGSVPSYNETCTSFEMINY